MRDMIVGRSDVAGGPRAEPEPPMSGEERASIVECENDTEGFCVKGDDATAHRGVGRDRARLRRRGCVACAALSILVASAALIAARPHPRPRLTDAAAPGGGGAAPAPQAVPVDRMALQNLGGGLTLRPLVPGDGETFPAAESYVFVHYTGSLEDGTVFDTSRAGNPFSFTLGRGRVIRGWDLALPHMSLGERAVIHIPNSMAYADRAHGKVPAGADLNFDIELLAVDTAAANLTIVTQRPGDNKTFPKARDRVTIHFRAYLPDGTKFDDTWERGRAYEFSARIGQVIMGWDLAVIQMSVGERARVHVPCVFAGGHKQMGPVPPDSDLDFEIELLAVKRIDSHCMIDNCPPPAPAGPVPLSPSPASAQPAAPSPAPAGAATGPGTDLGGGLRLEEVAPGDGRHFPSSGDSVTVHYVGTLAADGHQCDSSRSRGEPITFQVGVGKVIRGWDAALPRMSLGQRARLHVPSAMAYGSSALPDIPANSALVFDVELLAIGGRRVTTPAPTGPTAAPGPALDCTVSAC